MIAIIILYNGQLWPIMTEDNLMAQYKSIDEARKAMKGHPLAKAGIVYYANFDNLEILGE